MPETIFFRLLAHDDKGAALADAIATLRDGRSASCVYPADPASFRQVPGSPFAYWVSDALRRKFAELPPFESEDRKVRLGDHPSDDFRYLRLFWEVPADLSRRDWRPYQKGGAFSPYYGDVHLDVDWDTGRQTYRAFFGRVGRSNERPSNYQFFFRPGLTWPRRTNGLSFRILPAGCVFADKGPAIFVTDDSRKILLALAAVINSQPFYSFVQMMTARFTLAQAFEVGLVQSTPVPNLSSRSRTWLAELAGHCVDLKRSLATADETTHVFHLPALLQVGTESLAARMAAWQARVAEAERQLAETQREVDDLAFRLYGIADEDRRAIEESPGSESSGEESTGDLDEDEVTSPPGPTGADLGSPGGQGADLSPLPAVPEPNPTRGGGAAIPLPASGRGQGVRSAPGAAVRGPQFAHMPPGPLPGAERGNDARASSPLSDLGDAAGVRELLSYAVGCALGRWDVRFATGERPTPELPDPFAPLPVCSPGMLTGDDGLPLREAPTGYPLRVDRDGILVDDPGHADDIVRRVRDVLALLWPSNNGSKAEAIEQEACEILGVKDLREYFRKPAGFFADHLKRYSKSRRQAPIYWPLSTASGSYTLWVYYHRLTSDTLYTAVNRYVEPKIAEVQRGLNELEGRLAGATGREATRLREQIENARAFLGELRDFRDELLRVAALPYRPDLNDGVIINAAPLHRLFRLPRWAKDTKECWEKLRRGDYDWAHLASTIWPDRVREKCRTDRSLAIAHDLEHLYVAPPASGQKQRGRAATARADEEDDG